MEPRIFGGLWNKYRPVLLQLMSASANGPQQYKLSDHEFRTLSPKEKGGYSFTLMASKGKALNNIRNSAVAKNLLEVLQQSGRASDLMNTATFEFILDKKFILHVNRKEEVVNEEIVTE